ncbi:BLOC-2 complex member HPS3-like [Diadema antillarum]|uniref:BLOC-2 complex member HPS3-like n=1 Tax=Diadema antillarum TaxID=105358 RepID=UPI003A858E28
MVQVLSCHHFKSQTVVSPSHEPLAVFASGNYLFVATSQLTVEVYRLDGAECTLIQQMKTVGVPWKGAFNVPGNYIALLEDETGTSNALRVYFNWRQSGIQENVTKARIAGTSSPVLSPSSETSSRHLEVVEVRTMRHILCMACCSENGNLVAGMSGVISIFRLTDTEGHHDFQHFIDIVITGNNFRVINVDILGAHLAFTSNHEAHVLLLNAQKFNITCSSISKVQRKSASSKVGVPPVDKSDMDTHQPPASLHSAGFVRDKHYVEWSCGPTGLSVDNSEGSRSEQIIQNCIMLPSILNEDYVKQKEGPAEILGPVRGVPGVAPFKIRHAKWTHSGKRAGAEKVTSYIHLLYCRFPMSEAGLTTVQLLPTYEKIPFSLDAIRTSGEGTSESFLAQSLVGMCCLLSTPKQGLVYDILDQVRPLSYYLYTAKAIAIDVGHDFLYAVSPSGLETYSHRITAAAIHNTESIDGVSNACPDPTTDICLVSLRPFLSVQTVASCDRHVILMCKEKSSGEHASNSDWSVYVLQKAPATDLLVDMIEMATSFRQASISAYQHLVLEAHLLARAKLLQCCYGNKDVGSGQEDKDADQEAMKRLFQETSALLGQVYAGSTCESEWPLTLPYLNMSERPISEILASITGSLQEQFKQEDLSLGPGLASYLDFKLFSGDASEVEMDKDTAERIIDVYSHIKPSRCSDIFLSGKLKEYLSPQKKLDVLQRLKQQQSQDSYQWSSTDNISMILIHLELGEMEQAKFATSCLTPSEVTELIPANAHLILSDDKQLTDFARLLCKEATDGMVEVLLQLLDNDKLSLKEAITLLKALHTGSSGHSLLLTRLLESVMSDSKWHHVFQEAMEEIVPIYLSQLLHADHPSMMNTSRACRRTHAHVPQGDGCFAARFSWLNNLAPFQGSLRQTCTSLEQKARSWRLQRGRSGSVTQPQTTTKSGASCPCCCCNEVLMRLQSLLCSDHLPSEVAVYVIEETEDMKDGRGRGSLQLLCQAKLDIKGALSLVIQEYPSIAVEFSSQHCGHSPELWAHVLADLVRGMEEKTTDGMETRKTVSLQMLSGVLGYLVQELDASTLLALLPSALPLAVTMPYMERALLRDKARRLRQELVALV